MAYYVYRPLEDLEENSGLHCGKNKKEQFKNQGCYSRVVTIRSGAAKAVIDMGRNLHVGIPQN